MPIGTLIVDVFNARTKKVIWRASATDVLSEKADQNDEKVKKTVKEMFKKFPVK